MTRVVVIEDEPAIADAICFALKTEGMDVDWRPTGGDGLAVIRDSGADLVVLDVGLPDANGFDLCREIRKDHDVPVIFLTARGEEVDRIVGLELGADDHVVKPFSPRELAARAKAVLRRSSRLDATGERFSYGPFSIDADKRRIDFGDAPLDLSRYEYGILDLLVRHPGKVYSRARLMELAWDEPDATLERTVDSHIKSSRAKLRAVDEEDDPIVTHRGVGYALREYE